MFFILEIWGGGCRLPWKALNPSKQDGVGIKINVILKAREDWPAGRMRQEFFQDRVAQIKA